MGRISDPLTGIAGQTTHSHAAQRSKGKEEGGHTQVDIEAYPYDHRRTRWEGGSCKRGWGHSERGEGEGKSHLLMRTAL